MVDLMFLAHNRLEFTRLTLETLSENTDFSLISTATVYDDMSVDGTSEWLAEFCKSKGLEYVRKSYGSVVLVMREAIQAGRAKYIAKVDNDTMVPPGWLNVCAAQLDVNENVDLLGIEAMHGNDPDPSVPRRCESSTHIGGIGLMRRSAFDRLGLPDIGDPPYFGFTAWQGGNAGRVVPAWLVPALPVCLLDHVPFEPWRSLSAEYVRKGWQRESWGEYPASRSFLWDWWAGASK